MVVTRSKAKAAAPMDAALSHPTSALVENPSVGKSNNAPTTTKKVATKKAATKKVATKKAATKKAGKANTTGTSNRRAGEDPPAVDPSLVVTLVDDLDNLDKEDLIEKVKDIFLHLGLQDIHVDLSDKGVNQVRRYFRITGDRLEDEVLRELMKLFLPGYEEKSKSVKKLVDHLRLAVFPAATLNDVPKMDNGKKYIDVALRATFANICKVKPQSSNGWTQEKLKKYIKEQEDSLREGRNRFRTDLTTEDLKNRLVNVHGYEPRKIMNATNRLHLLKKLWKVEDDKLDDDTTKVPRRANAAGGATPHAAVVPPPLRTVGAEIGGAHFNNDNNELMPQEVAAAAVIPPTPNANAGRMGGGATSNNDNNELRELTKMVSEATMHNSNQVVRLNEESNDLRKTSNFLMGRLGDMENRQDGFDNRLDGFGNRQDEFEVTIDEFGREIGHNTAKIGHNTAKIGHNEANIKKLSTQLTELTLTVQKTARKTARKFRDTFTPSPTSSSSNKNSGSTSARGLTRRIKFASSSSSTKKSGKSGNKPSKSPLRKNLFPGGEEEEDAKQQATNENLNIATPAKPISQAGNEVATVHPPVPSPATSAVGSIVVNDDGNDDNLGDDNHGVEVVAQINLRNDDNGGLRVENVAALNEGGKEEEDSNSKQQAKNENQNIATPNGVEVSFTRNHNAYRNINDGLDSSPEAGSPMSMSVDSANEDEDAAGNDQGGGVLSPSIIQRLDKLSLVSPPSDTNK